MSDQPRVYGPETGWKDLAPGGVIPQAGNAEEYSVAGWRIYYPARDNDACIDCLFCWMYCPDNAIIVEEASVKGKPIDMVHCKGCGICAAVCPKDCIAMVLEADRDKQKQGG